MAGTEQVLCVENCQRLWWEGPINHLIRKLLQTWTNLWRARQTRWERNAWSDAANIKEGLKLFGEKLAGLMNQWFYQKRSSWTFCKACKLAESIPTTIFAPDSQAFIENYVLGSLPFKKLMPMLMSYIDELDSNVIYRQDGTPTPS